MAPYTTAGDLRARFALDDFNDDTLLNHAIDAASVAIDDETGRRFYLDEEPSARQYRRVDSTVSEPDGELFLVDDIGSLTGLVVELGDGTTWTAVTDFSPEPLNALTQSKPVTQLRRNLGVWPDWQVRVTARWGWPAVPTPIKNATEILASRLFRRKDAPFGVAGFADFGAVRLVMDPDVARLIGPYQLSGIR
jgi:hypothetical protein